MNDDTRPPHRSLPQLGPAAASDAPDTGPVTSGDEAALVTQGWERRHMVGPDRAEESRELYESLGFEVILRAVSPVDFGADCRECGAACNGWVTIYTRRGRPPSDGG